MSSWHSFEEYVLTVAQYWWAIVPSGVVAIMGWLFPELNIPAWVWVIVGLSGLIVAQFLTFHKVRQERDKIKSTMPLVASPEIIFQKDYKAVYIGIKNFGGKGTFSATAEVKIPKRGELIPVRLPWRDTSQFFIDIPTNETALIPLLDIQEFEDGLDVKRAIIMNSYSLEGYVPLMIVMWNQENINDTAKIQINITSDPPVLGGPLLERYLIHFDESGERIVVSPDLSDYLFNPLYPM